MPFIDQQLVANGSTALGRIVAAKAIRDAILNDQVLTMAVNAGGTGYVVGETFELSTGTVVGGMVCRGIVTAESGGIVSAVKILSSGAYSADPTLTASPTTNSSAAGNDDLTVDITMQTARWTTDRDTYTDDLTDFEWIATSIKAANPATIGLDTILSGADGGWQMLAASGFDNGQTWLTQPGAPPDNEMFMNAPGTDPRLYMSLTERRVNICIRDGAFSQYGGVGLFIPFTNIDANYPFPAFCHGQRRGISAFSENRSATNSGIVNPNNYLTPGQLGPCQYRDNLSPGWLGIADDNNQGAEDQTSQMWPAQGDHTQYSFTHAPVPTGSSAAAANMNPHLFSAGTLSELEWFQNNASSLMPQGVAPFATGGRMSFTTECHIIANQPGDVQSIGIIDGFEAVHGRGLTAFEEIITESGQRYLVFNDTNTADLFRWVAMEKL